MRYVDVKAGVASSSAGNSYPVDTAILANKGVAIVAFPGGNADPWFEREDFRGREQDTEIIEAAAAMLDEAEAQAGEEGGHVIDEGIHSVSAFQAFAALEQAGFLDDVEAYMSDPDTPRIEKLAFEKARNFERDSPTVAKLAEYLGLSDQQVDDLFLQASQIQA